MKTSNSLCLGLVLCISLNATAIASETTSEGVVSEAHETVPPAQDTRVAGPNDDFCFVKGAPPSDIQYARIREMKLGKQTYGSARDLLDELAADARAQGADAIINYYSSQRFGFWPWRVIRPVVRGTAVKWRDTAKPDCKKVGGATLAEILRSNKVAPAGERQADQTQGAL